MNSRALLPAFRFLLWLFVVLTTTPIVLFVLPVWQFFISILFVVITNRIGSAWLLVLQRRAWWPGVFALQRRLFHYQRSAVVHVRAHAGSADTADTISDAVSHAVSHAAADTVADAAANAGAHHASADSGAAWRHAGAHSAARLADAGADAVASRRHRCADACRHGSRHRCATHCPANANGGGSDDRAPVPDDDRCHSRRDDQQQRRADVCRRWLRHRFGGAGGDSGGGSLAPLWTKAGQQRRANERLEPRVAPIVPVG